MSTNDPYGQQPAQQPYPGAYGAGAPQQPAYGYAPTAYPAQQPTNTMAIVALVGSFFIPLVGIICGHISLNQIKKSGEQGRGLAMAGLIIGYVYTALIVVVVVIYILFFVILFASIPASTY